MHRRLIHDVFSRSDVIIYKYVERRQTHRYVSTMFQQNLPPFIFVNNFGKCIDRFSKPFN